MGAQQRATGCNQQGAAGNGNAQKDDASLGVGDLTSGQDGATPLHETQHETGGSGGGGLTGSQVDEAAPKSAQPGSTQDGDVCDLVPEPPGSHATAAVRGPQDTHSEQAGWTKTGLGVPETGGNQTPEDLERKHKPK